MHVGIANPRWRENVPGIPGACATHKFTYRARGPCIEVLWETHRRFIVDYQWSIYIILYSIWLLYTGYILPCKNWLRLRLYTNVVFQRKPHIFFSRLIRFTFFWGQEYLVVWNNTHCKPHGRSGNFIQFSMQSDWCNRNDDCWLNRDCAYTWWNRQSWR